MWRTSGVFLFLSLVVVGWLVSELGLLGYTKGSAAEKVPAAIENLQNSLQNREIQLNDKDRELLSRERALADKEQVLTQQIAAYEKVIRGLKEKVAENERRQKATDASFIQIYEKMDPKKAARILDELEVELAVNILRSMRPSIAAEVLGNMSSKKAKLITERQLLGGRAVASAKDESSPQK